MMNSSTIEQNTKSASPLLPWLVVFSAALLFFYEFIQMNMFDAISSSLMRSFSVNGTDLGYLSATYLLGDVLLLFPAGMILDRFSVRKVIITAILICITGTLLFATATTYKVAAFAHLLAGVGNAFSFLSCIMLASRWFPPRKMALVIGLVVTFAMAGGLVAQTPLTILAAKVGWRHAVMFNAVLGVIIFGFIWTFVQDYPTGAEDARKNKQKELNEIGVWTSVKMSLSKKQNWLGGIYTSFLNLPIMVLGALWGELQLRQIHHFSKDQASYVTSMIYLGTIFGSPIIGWISDRLGRRRMPMIICAVFSIITLIAILFLPNVSLSGYIALYFLLGFITAGQIITYPLLAESNPRVVTGTAMGLASVLIMGGAGIAQPLFGWVLDLGWNHLIVNGVHVYSANDYFRAMMIIFVAFIIGLIAAFMIRETYCKPVAE